jgi:hypothetical protein
MNLVITALNEVDILHRTLATLVELVRQPQEDMNDARHNCRIVCFGFVDDAETRFRLPPPANYSLATASSFSKPHHADPTPATGLKFLGST